MSEVSNATDSSRRAKSGDTVTLEYTGTLSDGRVFDKATPENPFVFTMGASQAMPAFESWIVGMHVGETKSFAIQPKDAYGIWHNELVITVPRDSFPPDNRIDVGKRAKVVDAEGNECVAKVIEITDASIKLDSNHPLAGFILNYNDVILTSLREHGEGPP